MAAFLELQEEIMLKVFLVEDEIIIREGIKNNINWEEEGLQFVGEASDGELAYPMIQNLKPDILITDIKMPFMDGLELSRLVKNELPESKIIILSGYNEFEYAKEAIKIGVTEYLLKPISSVKLLQAVKEVADKILEERKQIERLESFKAQLLEHKQNDRQKLFNDLVYKEVAMSEILSRAGMLEMDLLAQCYCIVLFKITGKEIGLTAYSPDAVEVTEYLINLYHEEEMIYVFERGVDGYALLIKGDSEQSVKRLMGRFKDDFIKKIEQYPSIEFFGGVGKCVQRLRELPESFDEANKAFSHRYMGRTNEIVSFDDVGEINLFHDMTLDLTNLDSEKLDRKILLNFLKSGSIHEIKHFLQDYFLGFGQNNLNSLLFRQYIGMDIYFGTIGFLEELGLDQTQSTIDSLDGGKAVSVFNTFESMSEYLEGLITKALIQRDTITLKKYDATIANAVSYIERNYANDEISLNAVSASVNMSPSYFSTIFAQEMGQTFIEFLTDVRMKKAKELLMCSNKKTSDIGYEVGYKDSHYFSYLFKKTQDCTPKEYRTRGRNQV